MFILYIYFIYCYSFFSRLSPDDAIIVKKGFGPFVCGNLICDPLLAKNMFLGRTMVPRSGCRSQGTSVVITKWL